MRSWKTARVGLGRLGVAASCLAALAASGWPPTHALAGGSGDLAADPDYQRATIFVEGGNHEGAREPLVALLVRKAGRLHLLASDPRTGAPALAAARAEVVELHRLLAVCEEALGRREEALAHLRAILDMDQDVSLDPQATPKSLIALMEEARMVRRSGPTPRFDLPKPGASRPIHLPPLAAISGQEVTLYLDAPGIPIEEAALLYCPGERCGHPFRVALDRKSRGPWVGKIPGPATTGVAKLYYYFETVSPDRRREVTAWFLVVVGENMNKLAQAADGWFTPRAVAEIRRRAVEIRLAPAGGPPEGAREVDSSSTNLTPYRSPY